MWYDRLPIAAKIHKRRDIVQLYFYRISIAPLVDLQVQHFGYHDS